MKLYRSNLFEGGSTINKQKRVKSLGRTGQMLTTLAITSLLATTAAAQNVAYSSGQDYFKVGLTLIFVVGLIFACAWVVRRMSGGVGVNQRHSQGRSGMPLVTREKLMMIRASSDYLLIGVTPNGINTLHQFDGPIDLSEQHQTSPFADRLKGLLKGLDSDPLAQNKKEKQNKSAEE